MDMNDIVTQLRQELGRIDQAIAALEGLGLATPRRGRPPKANQAVPAGGRKRHTMSAAARARISAAQKARWAKQKGQARGKKATAAKKKGGRKPMSPAMRKKLSAMMKARWAARKKGS